MKKLLVVAIVVFGLWDTANAQNSSFQFLYITKDYNTKVNPLIEEIKDIYDFVRGDSSCGAIFYLPDRDTPIVVKVNLPGDNHKDIDRIFSALVTKSETAVNPSADLKRIPELLEEHPLLSPAGRTLFTEVEFRFYVSPTFWELFYNEQVIASLWFILELDQAWARNYVSLNVFHQKGDGLVPDAKQPFGPMDLCANYKFQLLTY